MIGNTDDFRVRALMAEHTGRKLSYGMKDADYTPANITYDDNGSPGLISCSAAKSLCIFSFGYRVNTA